MSKALIIGVASVDGSYLSELLLSKNYQVVGTVRSQGDDLENISAIKTQLSLDQADLLDYQSLLKVIKAHQPDEIYNLAALSLPSDSWQQAALTAQVNGFGPVHLLEAIRTESPHSKLFQATSREIFGTVSSEYANEDTPVKPTNPYGAAKAYAHFMMDIYRRNHKLFAVSGILFNHESPRRPTAFVTRKITAAAACIKNQVQNNSVLNSDGKLELFDLESPRDRGFAPEYVEAMWRTLQLDQPQDFIIATGETHTLRETCEIAFSSIGLNYQDYVVVHQSLNTTSPDSVKGDFSRLKAATGWSPKTSFSQLISLMVNSDLKIFSNK